MCVNPSQPPLVRKGNPPQSPLIRGEAGAAGTESPSPDKGRLGGVAFWTKQAGVTLIELVLTIVVLSIVAVGLMQAQAVMVARSADPMLARQALAIAESYIEEMSAKAFVDPDSCPAAPVGGRPDFSAACQFNGITQAPTDQSGTLLASLAAYSVAITVVHSDQLNGLANTQALRMTVAVTDPLGHVTRLSGYRARQGL